MGWKIDPRVVAMDLENDSFSLLSSNDGQSIVWTAVIGSLDSESSNEATGDDLFRLTVENDHDLIGDEVFQISEFPTGGMIGFHAAEFQSGITSFDLDSVRRGDVVYLSRGRLPQDDRFSFHASATKANHDLQFKLIRSSQKLRLKQCAKVEVSVGGMISLGKELLEATSPTNTPDEVLFTASRPRHGHLIFQSESDSAVEVSSFSQSMVNDGQIIYQHSGDAPGVDHFRFNVVDRSGSTVGERMFRIRIVDRD